MDRLAPALQSDIPACIWMLRFAADGEASAAWRSDLGSLGQDDFIWLHLDGADARLTATLSLVADLSEEVRQTLATRPDHPNVEEMDGAIVGVLPDHEVSIDGAHHRTAFLSFAIGRSCLVTIRRSPLYAPQGTRRALSSGFRVETPLALFERLVVDICDCSARMARDMTQALDRIEDNVVLEGRGRDQRAPLGFARRKAVRLARQISGLLSTLQRLEEVAEDQDRQDLADTAAALTQRADALSRDVSNVQDRARMLQDEINAILTLETNDRLYTLTLLTAVILPATFVTGFFGMNTKQLFFFENDNGTIYATLLCVVASMGTLLAIRWMGLFSADAALTDASEKAVGRTAARRRLST